MTKKLPKPLVADKRAQSKVLHHLKNWVECHKFLMTLATEDYATVGHLLALELTGRKRSFMLYRLTARYNHARALAFHREVAKYALGQGRSIA